MSLVCEPYLEKLGHHWCLTKPLQTTRLPLGFPQSCSFCVTSTGTGSNCKPSMLLECCTEWAMPFHGHRALRLCCCRSPCPAISHLSVHLSSFSYSDLSEAVPLTRIRIPLWPIIGFLMLAMYEAAIAAVFKGSSHSP